MTLAFSLLGSLPHPRHRMGGMQRRRKFRPEHDHNGHDERRYANESSELRPPRPDLLDRAYRRECHHGGDVHEPEGQPANARRTYHHGDLPRALLAEAVRTIQRHGIAALTLRHVGATLGVSRNALYRHFANKDALLHAVAAEGLRLLQVELQRAWQRAGGGVGGSMPWARRTFVSLSGSPLTIA